MKYVLACLAAAACAFSAHARIPAQVSYTCDVEGAVGVLDIEYEGFDPAGQEMPTPFEQISGAIDDGSVIFFYKGTLSFDDKSYVITGEDRTAEFTDMATLDRFLASMKYDDGVLRIIKHKDGTSEEPFFCQLNQVVAARP